MLVVIHFIFDNDFPPNYEAIRELERNLPQHNLSLPFPEGQNGRYVKFSCGITKLGWNNVLNELHLAYKSNRAYVFSDFIWQKKHYPWPLIKARNWPPRTPLSALISGPTVGGPWGPNDSAPRSISEEWFDVVCPPKKRRIIITRDVKPALSNFPGNEVSAAWEKLLIEAPESCIEIQPAPLDEDSHPQDGFLKSPVTQLLGTAHVVQRNVDANAHLFKEPSYREVNIVDPYSRMLAIHVRRGDYKAAYTHLSNWNSTFYSWNLHHLLPDQFTPPPGGYGEKTSEKEAAYMTYCLPSEEQILAKIRDSRKEYLEEVKKEGKREGIDVLYILTNDRSSWLDEIKKHHES